MQKALYKSPVFILSSILFLSIASLAFSSSTSVEGKYLSYLKEYGQTPTDYLVDRFDDHDIVLLGEDHAIKDNLEFVTSLIPHLHKAGIFNLGMEFGACEMQSQMDQLTSGKNPYNPQLAKDMMFFYNVGWPYKEYTDVAKAVWEFNRNLPPNTPKFRILNMSYQYNWSNFREPFTDQKRREVFFKGEPDHFRAKIVSREVLDKGGKGLLLVGSVHAYTRFHTPVYENGELTGECKSEWLGNLLLEKYGDRITNIMLHYPFAKKPGHKPRLQSPGNGQLESILISNGEDPVGFDLLGSPLGKIRDDSNLSTLRNEFTLDQLFDGYIFLKPLSKLQGSQVDPSFYDNRTWESITTQHPDPNWHPLPEDLESYLTIRRNYADLEKRYADLRQKD